MISYPNAKINLGLHVLSKREDGFHDIDTVIYPVPFCDILEMLPSPDGQFRFSVSGLDVKIPLQHNLCVKALNILRQYADIPEVHLHLHKQIPMGAGLGGGSSDASFTMKMANTLFQLGFSEDDLERISAEAGSDCPFFIRNRPAVAAGRGEQLSSFPFSLKGYHLVLIKPGISISTAEAYGQVRPQSGRTPLSSSTGLPVEQWQDEVVNDFEVVIMQRYPEAVRMKDALRMAGAVFTQMTGSGSAFFALFSELPDLPDWIRVFQVFSGPLGDPFDGPDHPM